jgi:hypothetical protein
MAGGPGPASRPYPGGLMAANRPYPALTRLNIVQILSGCLES